MDLGISGRWAIVLGSTKGLGRACAESVAGEGVNLVINARTAADVDATVRDLSSRFGVQVVGVSGDATTDEVQSALLEACSTPDIVLLNGGGPPPAKFAELDAAAWDKALSNGLVGPLAFVQKFLPGMCERGFGRVVVVSSAMVKSPNSMMSLSVGSRLALTGVLKGLARDVARYGVTVNQLLPERFDTDRQEQMAKVAMRLRGISYEEARAEQVASIRAGRLGRPEEFGAAFAFLCSAQSGFLTGQSIQLDGGSYEGVL